MPSADWLVPSVLATVVSTLAMVVAMVIRARLDLRSGKLAAQKSPAEITDLIAGSAGEVVATMAVAMQENRERIKELEADGAEKDRRIEHLEQDLNRAHVRIGKLQGELDRLRPLSPDHP